MPDEINDQLGNDGASAGTTDQQKDGSKVQKTEDQGMDGQGHVQIDAYTADKESAAETAVSSEEEPVGSNRTGPRVIKKMSASDFRIKPEPKPPAPEPVHEPPARQRETEQAPVHEPAAVSPIRPGPELRAAAAPEPPLQRPVQEETAAPAHVTEPTGEPKISGLKNGNTASGGFMDAIWGILSFFTIFKINAGEREIRAMNRKFYLVPIAGLVIGVIASAIGILFAEIRAAVMIPIAVLGTIYILSKFLHFDGLADFGDGMVAGGGKEDKIRALKDTRIGAGGLGIALITVIATYAALSGIWIAFALAAVIVIMEVFAKNAMVAAAVFGEPGTGMASEQVRNANTETLLISTAVSAAVAFAGYLLMGIATSFTVMQGMLNTVSIVSAALLIAAAAVSSVLIGWLMAYLSNKNFGFVNGDVLGATNEVSRLLILFAALLVVNYYTIPAGFF